MAKLTRQKVLKDMEDEIKRIDKIREEVNSGKIEDERSSEDYREPLSLDIKKEVTILLSWGGPSDGFKLMFSADNELLNGVYFVADWGDYQEVELNEDELQKVFDFYMYGDTSLLEK